MILKIIDLQKRVLLEIVNKVAFRKKSNMNIREIKKKKKYIYALVSLLLVEF